MRLFFGSSYEVVSFCHELRFQLNHLLLLGSTFMLFDLLASLPFFILHPLVVSLIGAFRIS